MSPALVLMVLKGCGEAHDHHEEGVRIAVTPICIHSGGGESGTHSPCSSLGRRACRRRRGSRGCLVWALWPSSGNSHTHRCHCEPCLMSPPYMVSSSPSLQFGVSDRHCHHSVHREPEAQDHGRGVCTVTERSLVLPRLRPCNDHSHPARLKSDPFAGGDAHDLVRCWRSHRRCRYTPMASAACLQMLISTVH
jgi:hypothetical protein